LKEANQIYARRGTRWALSRVLEIYLGQRPDIIENSDGLNPYTFKVKIPLSQKDVNQELVEQLINTNKPAYTAYSIEYSEKK
jgi:P2-related tail formation protein